MVFNNLTIAWQTITTSKMPVTVTYNVAYNTLLFIAVTTSFSTAASAQEQIIIVSPTNTNCLIKSTWNGSGTFLGLTIGI